MLSQLYAYLHRRFSSTSLLLLDCCLLWCLLRTRVKRGTFKFHIICHIGALCHYTSLRFPDDTASPWCGTLTDSRAAVQWLARPTTSNPTTSLTSRHAAVLVKRHLNISIRWTPAHTDISGNTRADELPEEVRRLPGRVDCVPDLIEACRALHSVVRLTAEEALGKRPPCLHRGLGRYASSALMPVRTGSAIAKAWLFQLSCELDISPTCEESETLDHILFECPK